MIGTMYPEQAEVFIDDCVVKGPKSMFSRSTIPGNDQIWVFIWKWTLSEFEWMEEAQESMELLKHLVSTAVPVRTLDYELVRKVKSLNQ